MAALGNFLSRAAKKGAERLFLVAADAMILVLLVGNALGAKVMSVLYITIFEHPCLGLLRVTLYCLLSFAFLVLA